METEEQPSGSLPPHPSGGENLPVRKPRQSAGELSPAQKGVLGFSDLEAFGGACASRAFDMDALVGRMVDIIEMGTAGESVSAAKFFWQMRKDLLTENGMTGRATETHERVREDGTVVRQSVSRQGILAQKLKERNEREHQQLSEHKPAERYREQGGSEAGPPPEAPSPESRGTPDSEGDRGSPDLDGDGADLD